MRGSNIEVILCPGLGIFYPVDVELSIASLKVAARRVDKQMVEYIFYHPDTCVAAYQNFIRIEELRNHAELLRIVDKLQPGDTVTLLDGKTVHVREHDGFVDYTSHYRDNVDVHTTFSMSTLTVHGAIYESLKEVLAEGVAV